MCRSMKRQHSQCCKFYNNFRFAIKELWKYENWRKEKGWRELKNGRTMSQLELLVDAPKKYFNVSR